MKAIQLYENQKLSKKDLYLIKQYNQINGYVKAYKKDLFNIQNGLKGDIDLLGQKAKGKELYKIKIDNIEVYQTNIELERLTKLENGILPIYKSKQQKERTKKNVKKIENKQILNNGVEMKMQGTYNYGISPLDYIENKYQANEYKQRVIENQQLIASYKKTVKDCSDYYKKHGVYNGTLQKKKMILKEKVENTIFY